MGRRKKQCHGENNSLGFMIGNKASKEEEEVGDIKLEDWEGDERGG